jgi:hypothetical protein
MELLLAVAILSAVFGVVATLWNQASGWGADIEKHSEALRLQRVLAMMKDQWSDRRTGVSLGEADASVVITDTQVSFTTATPILFPDWPLVVATYRIEKETDPGRVGLWRLVYEEARVSSGKMQRSDVAREPGTTWEAGRDPRGRPLRDRTVLLAGMSGAQFERFGPAEEADDTVPDSRRSRRANTEGTEPAPDGSNPQEPETERDRQRADRQRRDAAAEAGDDAEDEPGLDMTATEREARRQTWRPMEEGGYPGMVPSVRLVGEFEKEKFACVLVILASR